MKKNTQILTVLFLIFTTTISIAQVGVNTTSPQTTLEVNGGVSLREGTELTLSVGTNDNVSLDTTPYSFYRITGPLGAYSISGIVPATGANGQIVTIENTTSHSLTITHDASTSTAANRIYCPGEKDFVLIGKYATLTLQYNASQSRWILIDYVNSHYGNNIQSTILSPVLPGVYQTIYNDVNVSFDDIDGATITFTPRHSKVYLSFSISGYNPLDGFIGDFQQSWFVVRVNNGGITAGNFLSLSATFDDLGGASGAATITAAHFPLDVTPNVPVTIKLQGGNGGTEFNDGFTIDTENYTSFMTILD